MRRWIFAALLLAACAPSNNHGYGWTFDEQASDGLRVRYFDDATPRLAQLDDKYQLVAQCMGIAPLPNGPLVIFADGVIERYFAPAYTWFDTGTIAVDPAIYADPTFAAFEWQIIEHEFVHHLLAQTGFPPDRNAAHDSPYFSTCTVL